MAISVNVTETVIDTDVTNTDVTVALTEQTTNVELTYPGPQGASAIVNVTTPITNTGTTTEPNIGIDQTLLSLARTQIVGTAITEAAGKALTAGTADYATLAGTSSFSTNAGTATYATNAGSATTSGTADYATLAGTAVNISGTIAPTQVTGTAAILGANTFTDQQTITPSSGTALTVNAVLNSVGLQINPNASSTSADTARFFHTNATVLSSFNQGSQLLVRGNLTTNTYLTSAITAYTGNDGYVGLVIRANSATQSANLQEWQNSSGTVLSLVNSAGLFESPRFTAKPTGGTFGLYAQNASATAIGIVARGAASQTANLQEWQNSGGTAIASVNSAGNLFVQSTQSNYAATTNIGVKASAASVIPLSVQAATSQTGDLTRWYSSDGTTVLSKIDSAGSLLIPIVRNLGGSGPYFSMGTTAITVRPASASNIGIVIRGEVSHTANLQEWQNNGGTTLAAVSDSGKLSLGANPSFGSPLPQLGVRANGDTVIPIVAKANSATQSADLQQWQDSTATLLASVSSLGIIRGAQIRTNANLALIAEASSGARLILGRMTAAAANPGANFGALYFRDGTTSGTLKLCVRAGAAGAETTILDNIPT